VLEGDGSRFTRRRDDFDPLVDEHPCERLGEIELRICVHDERELAGRHWHRRIDWQAEPTFAFDVG
jgi:hypothetical protein